MAPALVRPAYRYRATVDHIHDGDTYSLTLDLGLHVSITVPIRLRGVNCPEKGTVAGAAATAFVQAVFGVAHSVIVQTHRDTEQLDRQSFARWVADVWVDGVSLAETLLTQGHAEVYPLKAIT